MRFKLARPGLLVILGLAVFLAGFGYELAFNAIPDQDPTADMIARWQFHARVAQGFYVVGLLVLIAGLSVALLRRFTARRR